MPAISSGDQTTLLTFPQGTKLGMAIFQPESIVTATATGSPAVGQETITLAGKSETEAPEKHYTVFAGSAAGLSDGGKARLISLTGSTMVVAPNFINWQTYPYITVKKVVEPWAILPDLNNDYEDGNVGYTNENTNYHPLGRIGGLGMVGYTDEAVNFWSDSTAMATGATLASHSWTFPSGSPSSSSSAGSAGSPIAVTWSSATGQTPHYIKYVVTDSNGKTHTRRMPVWIFDSIDDSYCDIRLESMSGSFDSGSWRATITALGDADIGQFPEDAMVVIFAKDHYAGHNTELGGNWTHQERVVFGGWIIRDTVFKDKDTGEVTFDVAGPVEKMKQLLCWPANLEDKSSPDGWHDLSNMTADRAAFHIMTEHTTMDQICDVVLSGNTKRFLYIDIPEDDPYTQIQDYIMKPIGANLLSDRQGRIYLDPNINLLPVASRTSTVIYSFDINDPIRNDPGLSLATEEHSWQVAQVDFVAFGYDGVDPRPYYSLAPGNQYHEGEVRKIDGIRADSQSESNSLAGLYLANENNIWREVKIPLFNWRVFDIAPQEYTELTLVASDTKRGLEWTAQKLICRHVEIKYEHKDGKLYVTPTFEKDSFGPAGITGDYPDEPPTNDGSGISPPSPVLPPTMSYNPQDLLIGSDGSGVWYLPIGGSAWENKSGSNTAVNQLGWDPWWFTPEKKGTNNPLEAIIWTVHDGAIYRSSNLGGTWMLKSVGSDPPNDWSDATAPTFADVTFVQRTDNIHKKDHHYFLGTWENGSSQWRSWLLVTEDDGATWSWVSLYDLMTGQGCDETYCYGTYSSMENNTTAQKTISASGVFSGDAGGDATVFTHNYLSGGGYVGQMGIIVDFGELLTVSGTSVVNVHIKSDPEDCTPTFPPGCCNNGWWSGLYINMQWSDDGITYNNGGGSSAWRRYEDTYDWTAAFEISSNFRYVKILGEPSYEAGDCDGWTMSIDSVRASNVAGSGGAPDEIRGIWMDVGSGAGEVLYLTAWTGADQLRLLKVDTGTYAATGSEISLGSCTIAELNNGTYYAAPFTPTFNDDRVYIWGRMTAPAGLAGVQHLIQSTDTGATFTSKVASLGTSVITNFRAEGEADGARTFYGVVSAAAATPKLYRGTETLVEVSDITGMPNGLNNVDSFGVRIDPDTGIASIGIGSNAGQAVLVVQSVDDGATWQDITLNLPTTNPITTCVFV